MRVGAKESAQLESQSCRTRLALKICRSVRPVERLESRATARSVCAKRAWCLSRFGIGEQK